MEFTEGKLLRVFVDEHDRIGSQPAYVAIVEFFRRNGIAGATVFRGIEGFGSHKHMHVATAFSWSPNVPLLIEVVDTWEALEPLLVQLEQLVPEGMATLEAVQYARLSRAE